MSNAPATPNSVAPVTPGVETISIKVDGRSIQVAKTQPDPITGKPIPTTMIQACAMAQTDVPHYCYHPKLPVAGNCRMCLVEFGTPAMGPDRKPVINPDGTQKIAKSPRPAIACATPISPGMEIYTNTPAVDQMRKGVMEFLLINHPLDCPICDQAGECKLQEYSVEFGQSSSRFVEEKVHKPKQVDLGPRIMLDDERCILCSRCVRFTRDIIGDDALGFVNRGSLNTLTTYPGKSFDNNYTLNTVDICPVGALTSKDFRFQMRVWFLKETKTLCTSCGTGCNTISGTRENKMYRYEPRQNDGVNSTWMCDAGRLNYKWVNRTDRLTEVMRKGQATTWHSIATEVVSVFKAALPGSVAIIASARQTNEELYLISKLASKLGAITDSVPRIGEGDKFLVSADKNPNSVGAEMVGIAASPMGSRLSQIADGIRAGRIRTLLVWGEDVTKIGISSELLAKLENLIVTDILPNATTAVAGYLLPGCAHLEKRGTFTNYKGRVQKFMRAIEPKGAARPEGEVLLEWLTQLSGENLPVSVEGIFHRMTSDLPAFGGLQWSQLGDEGVDLSVPRSEVQV